MKLIPVVYYGFTGMDRRFSSPMLPWIVSEIRKRDYCEKLSLGIEDGILQAYNPDFELQFSHKIWQVTRFSQADQDPTTFLYLMRDDNDRLLYCYLFQAEKASDVLHMVDRVLDPMTISTSLAHNPTAFDFLASPQKWKIHSEKLTNFYERVKLHNQEALFKADGSHTFLIPIDSKIDDYKLQSIDRYVIDAHVIPNQILFTRPAKKNFIFETAANGDYIYIVASLIEINGKLHVKSYTVLGNSSHKKGEVVSEIILANIPVSNGVVHLISEPLAVFERELRPFPYLSVFYKISADPVLNLTYQFGEKSGINDQIKNESVLYTYFAPRDKPLSLFVDLSDSQMREVLGYHVVMSTNRYSMQKLLLLSKSNDGVVLFTLSGVVRFDVLKDNNGYSIKWRNKTIRVYRGDYECSNGIVHIIDGVFGEEPKPEEVADDSSSESSGFWSFFS